MRLLTKGEACRELSVSLSTLDRQIAAGEIQARREPRGRRHRVYVMLDDGPPENVEVADSPLAVARERIRGLEAQLERGPAAQRRTCQPVEVGAGTAWPLVAVLVTSRPTRRQWPCGSIHHLRRACTGCRSGPFRSPGYLRWSH